MAPDEAHRAAARGEILLVDIRRPDEWSDTGIGEFAVPLDLRSDGFIAGILAAQENKAQPVAVICARGVRSARTTLRLVEAGISPVIDVPEGMLGSRAGPGWLARHLPTVSYPL
ncbi:rhodanese-like domain-containing protein [Harenicola maris]